MKQPRRTVVSFAEGITHYAKRQGFILPPGVIALAQRIPGRFALTDDHETAERVTCVLCMPDGGGEYFPDDIRTVCARCGRGIHHRPDAPKRPPKLCIDCVMNGPEDGTASDWQRYIRHTPGAGDQPGKQVRRA